MSLLEAAKAAVHRWDHGTPTTYDDMQALRTAIAESEVEAPAGPDAVGSLRFYETDESGALREIPDPVPGPASPEPIWERCANCNHILKTPEDRLPEKLPPGLMLEYTRLDGMWQHLVRENFRLRLREAMVCTLMEAARAYLMHGLGNEQDCCIPKRNALARAIGAMEEV